jgi:hypothetical protein
MKTGVSLLKGLQARFGQIREQYGVTGLILACPRFLFSPIYKCNLFYLYENLVRPDYEASDASPRIKTDILNFKVVSSNQDADKLEADNFKFRTCYNEFNYDRKIYSRWLDCGAIAFCTFVGTEFAAINWVIPSQQAQDKTKTIPLTVDYSNHEVFLRGTWVNPKYRGLKLYRYTARNRDRFLSGIGVNKTLTTIEYTNRVGHALVEALGSKQYGKGKFVKILWWKTWKETYHNQSNVSAASFKVQVPLKNR